MRQKNNPGLIFIVDDIQENRDLAKIYLEKLGWKTLCCESGRQALVELETATPHAILLDIKMPGIDGISMAKVIRCESHHDDLKIVGYTAHALNDEIQFILDSGFDEILIKPVTYRDLSDCFGTNDVVFL